MARPVARGLGPGLGLKYEIVLRAGPAWTYFLRARPGPGLIIHFAAGPGPVCRTAAGPGRAWASNHICGPGLGLDFRPVRALVQRDLADYSAALQYCHNLVDCVTARQAQGNMVAM